MKLIELIKLGHRSVSAHKKRSLITIFLISILSGAFLSFIFLIEGLVKTIDDYSKNLRGDSSVITLTTNCKSAGDCSSASTLETLVAEKARPYGGKTLVSLESAYFIPEEYLRPLVEVSLASLKSEETSPRLYRIVSLETAASLADPSSNSRTGSTKVYSLSEINSIKNSVLGKEFVETHQFFSSAETAEGDSATYEEVTVSYVVVGVVGTSEVDLSEAVNFDSHGPFSLVFQNIRSGVAHNDIYIDDGSELVTSLKSYKEYAVPAVLTKFTSTLSAFNYYDHEDCSANINCSGEYSVSEWIGGSLAVRSSIKSSMLVIYLVGAIVTLATLTISVFSFIRLVNENAGSAALYHSLGASNLDIFLIYLSYLIEICLMSIILSSVIGLIIAVVMSSQYSLELSDLLTSMFARDVSVEYLFGFGTEVLVVYGAILLSAPLCSLLTLDQLSAANIAKRLKE
ncbi:hypothetical protein IJH27_00160 [Candidatus Saccharibacteria bacterium]|nr:hypothetical protein [Candidatus Saccharibacteria bacterium]